MKFVDEITIRVRSGKGGAGLVSFHTARNRPKLGADGGDGGFGGHVYIQGDSRLNTLAHLGRNRIYAAEPGAAGGTNAKTGRNGKSLKIPVPLGTLVRNSDSKQVLGEVLKDGEELKVCTGGKRGLGNRRFLSSIRQAPEEYTSGGSGEEATLSLELKLIADIGLVGFPNAGKSTLLSVISDAKPKIASYPFTTLNPHLGVVSIGQSWEETFVVADIPGLIPGAAEGRGLGHQFLKHIERTKALAFVIDGSQESPGSGYQQLLLELGKFNSALRKKPTLLIVTKQDLFWEESHQSEIIDSLQKTDASHIIFVSAATGYGISNLRYELYNLLKNIKEPQVEKTDASERVDDDEWLVKDPDGDLLFPNN